MSVCRPGKWFGQLGRAKISGTASITWERRTGSCGLRMEVGGAISSCRMDQNAGDIRNFPGTKNPQVPCELCAG
jgi:hypothetical protein